MSKVKENQDSCSLFFIVTTTDEMCGEWRMQTVKQVESDI